MHFVFILLIFFLFVHITPLFFMQIYFISKGLVVEEITVNPALVTTSVKQ